MRQIFLGWFAIGAVIATSPAARSADYKVIVNSSVNASSVSAEDLRNVFLIMKSSLGDGSHVTPVIESSGPGHEAFLKECLGKMDSAFKAYYRNLVFTGKGAMPKSFAGDAEVVAYVANTKGAIGYVSAAAATPGVKLLNIQ